MDGDGLDFLPAVNFDIDADGDIDNVGWLSSNGTNDGFVVRFAAQGSVPKQEAYPRTYPNPRISEDNRLRPARPRTPPARTSGTPAVLPEGLGVVYTQSPTRRGPRFALTYPTRPA